LTEVEAVVFDLDGVLVDSEHLWDEVREELARERNGRWHDRAQADMMGMSSTEWSRYMHEVIGLASLSGRAGVMGADTLTPSAYSRPGSNGPRAPESKHLSRSAWSSLRASTCSRHVRLGFEVTGVCAKSRRTVRAVVILT